MVLAKYSFRVKFVLGWQGGGSKGLHRSSGRVNKGQGPLKLLNLKQMRGTLWHVMVNDLLSNYYFLSSLCVFIPIEVRCSFIFSVHPIPAPLVFDTGIINATCWDFPRNNVTMHHEKSFLAQFPYSYSAAHTFLFLFLYFLHFADLCDEIHYLYTLMVTRQ